MSGLKVLKLIRRAVIIKARLIAADRITFSRHQDKKRSFISAAGADAHKNTH